MGKNIGGSFGNDGGSVIMRECKHPKCDKLFSGRKGGKVYCSKRCKDNHWAMANREYYVEYGKEYRKTEKAKESFRRGDLKYKANPFNVEKIKARQRAKYRFGNVKRTCSMENCFKIGEKHHPDYSKPFEVIFLCVEHHKFEHRLAMYS